MGSVWFKEGANSPPDLKSLSLNPSQELELLDFSLVPDNYTPYKKSDGRLGWQDISSYVGGAISNSIMFFQTFIGNW